MAVTGIYSCIVCQYAIDVKQTHQFWGSLQV